MNVRILQLCANYPGPKEKAALSYVKARNLHYRDNGIPNITVLNFSLPVGRYVDDEFDVISLNEYKEKFGESDFDVLICHAPNIRNHYFFLKKYKGRFKEVVFFFHGHEVLSINKEYPAAYSYLYFKNLSRIINRIYDPIKFFLWRHYFLSQGRDTNLIFVSQWIKEKFQEYIRISLDACNFNYHVISNSISPLFEKKCYDINSKKEYDFITIRSNLDDPKYAVDIVNNIAKANPQYQFLLVGKGDFFNHYEKSTNIIQIERYLTPKEIIDLLNLSKCALMPTKNDTQGILACEMATFGIPLITSDIDVCKLIFDGFPNVAFISNTYRNLELKDIVSTLAPSICKTEKYFAKNTIDKEIELIKKITNNC